MTIMAQVAEYVLETRRGVRLQRTFTVTGYSLTGVTARLRIYHQGGADPIFEVDSDGAVVTINTGAGTVAFDLQQATANGLASPAYATFADLPAGNMRWALDLIVTDVEISVAGRFHLAALPEDLRGLEDASTTLTVTTNGSSVTLAVTGGSSSLSGLSDTALTGPSNLDVLQYVTASSAWLDRSLAEAGIAPASHTHTPADLTTFVGLPVEIGIACSDESTALETGTVATFRMPYAMTLTAVRANVTEAPTDASLIVDINETGASVLSQEIVIDAGDKTSVGSGTPAVISDAALADDAQITIDIDQIGSTVAGAGLKVWLIGTRA